MNNKEEEYVFPQRHKEYKGFFTVGFITYWEKGIIIHKETKGAKVFPLWNLFEIMYSHKGTKSTKNKYFVLFVPLWEKGIDNNRINDYKSWIDDLRFTIYDLRFVNCQSSIVNRQSYPLSVFFVTSCRKLPDILSVFFSCPANRCNKT